jgi:hypothetical protein
MTDKLDWPEFPEDLPKYDDSMTREECRAVVDAHLDLIRPYADHPDPDVRAHVAERIGASEKAWKRLDGFYKVGALPRIPEDVDFKERLAIEKARRKEMRAANKAAQPSLWSRLTGNSPS